VNEQRAGSGPIALAMALGAAALLFPLPAHANMVSPIESTIESAIVVCGIALCEAICIYLLANKVMGMLLRFTRAFRMALFANLISSVAGTLAFALAWQSIPGDYLFPFLGLPALFACTVLIEWGIYFGFIKKGQARKGQLFRLSFAANLITYSSIIIIPLIIRVTNYSL
jgi:hypothetical protein